MTIPVAPKEPTQVAAGQGREEGQDQVPETVHVQVQVVRPNQDKDDIVNPAPNQQQVEAVQGQQDQGNIMITFIIGVLFLYVNKGNITKFKKKFYRP